ncbi:MAG: alpha-2-macroglobulin [Gammaproteobacteria bacterium]|nr:alpha-2-macroglobulin [Gammaproteobacteria bacterium]
MRYLPFLSGLLCALAVAGQPAAAAPPRVAIFTPSGSAKAPPAVHARFSAPMVAFGEPRLPAPFSHDCPVTGHARWLDSRNWVFDFDPIPPAGLRCRFVLSPGLQSVSGAAVDGPREFRFDTGGPSILQSEPREGSSIEDEQVFLLGLSAPTTPAEIQAHAHCRADGVNEQIELRLLEGEARLQLLTANPYFVQSYASILLGPRYEATMMAHTPADVAPVRERFMALMSGENSPIVVATCRQRLPVERKVWLEWGPGIATATGVATTEPQTLAYATRPAFSAKLQCQRAHPNTPCIPALDMRVNLSAATTRSAVAQIVLTAADGQRYPAIPEGSPADAWVQGATIKGPFPALAKLVLTLPDGLVDDAGRKLVNAASFPLTVPTGENPPLAKFAADFGVVELNAAPALPLTIRDLEPHLLVSAPSPPPPAPSVAGFIAELGTRALGRAPPADPAAGVRASLRGRLLRVPGTDIGAIAGWFAAVQSAKHGASTWNEKTQQQEVLRSAGQTEVLRAVASATDFQIPRTAPAKAMEVIGIALPQPGFYVAEVTSPRLGAALLAPAAPYYAQGMALVTNLGVHFKWGRESSLVWVTALDTGQPVARATVSIQDCSGKTRWEGHTDGAGLAAVSEALPTANELPACAWNGHGLIATATLGEDTGFVASGWNNGIATWRFGLPGPTAQTPHTVATVFDRPLFRVGETVHMKQFLRTRSVQGFAPWLPDGLTLRIRHDASGAEFPLTAPVDAATSSAITQWTIPPEARQGVYRVEAADGDAWLPAGDFRVESFRVPLLRANLQTRGLPWINPTTAPLDLQINFLGGGPAGALPIKLRGLVEARAVSFPDYEDYVFLNGDVTTGLVEQSDTAWSAPQNAAQFGAPQPLAAQSVTLDPLGGARLTLTDVPVRATPQTLTAEIEYPDPNGEILSAVTRVPLWPSNIVLGLKPESWALNQNSFNFSVVALDFSGKPLAAVDIVVDLFQRLNYSHRKRLLGGFYAYENRSEVKALGPACSGRTNAAGELRCTSQSPVAGSLILRARAHDAQGNASVVNRDVWVAGESDWWYALEDHDRMELLSERREYAPGETARLQVRMPFREATALVTLEREGVLESRVVQLSGKSPVIELPIPANAAPNVFVSVLAVRGRDAAVAPTARVDLGRPAFKLGMTELRVGWQAQTLNVTVTPERPDYRVRETALVDVSVRRADGGALAPATEIALAAVDEGLLELRANDSWQLLTTMMQRRGIEVQTATAQMQVLGRRHYGRKAVAPGGGGGGGGGTRTLFETLLSWQPRVKLDPQGHARLSIPLNDTLSSFRVVAVASGGPGHFGTGSASLRTSQDLMLYAGLPTLVREGDRLQARFSVRNAGTAVLATELTATVTALLGADAQPAPPTLLPAQAISLAPGQTQEISWPYPTPDARELRWQIHAASGALSDALLVRQRVLPRVEVASLQADVLQLKTTQSLAVSPPADALPGRGGLRVSWQARLGEGLPGVGEYLRASPYQSFEQRLSSAIAHDDVAAWNALMAALPAHLDSDGLVRYFPGATAGSDILSSYLLALAHAAGRAVPAALRQRLREGLVRFIDGTLDRPSPLATADLTQRKLAAIAALSGYPEGINTGWLESIDVSPALWPTATLVDFVDLLRRSPGLPARGQQLAAALVTLRGRLQQQGGLMTLAAAPGTDQPWLMVSGDATLNRILLSVLETPDWADEVPRLVAGSLARQRAGHWDTALANAWGALALRQFSARFEATPVAGQSSLTLGDHTTHVDWTPPPSAPTVLNLPWPVDPTHLTLQHHGVGAPWVSVESRAASALTAPLASGYTLTRTRVPVAQSVPGEWHRGDVYEVRLEVNASTDMTWVVVRDPLPAGATALGAGLGGDSSTLAPAAGAPLALSPTWQERLPEAWQAYFEYAPQGRWTLQYRVRLNHAGTFSVPPSRVDALYAPGLFAALPNEAITVLP